MQIENSIESLVAGVAGSFKKGVHLDFFVVIVDVFKNKKKMTDFFKPRAERSLRDAGHSKRVLFIFLLGVGKCKGAVM